MRLLHYISAIAQIPLDFDTFDVSNPCILAVLSLSNSTARHARHDDFDWLDTSNVTWRAKWKSGICLLTDAVLSCFWCRGTLLLLWTPCYVCVSVRHRRSCWPMQLRLWKNCKRSVSRSQRVFICFLYACSSVWTRLTVSLPIIQLRSSDEPVSCLKQVSETVFPRRSCAGHERGAFVPFANTTLCFRRSITMI